MLVQGQNPAVLRQNPAERNYPGTNEPNTRAQGTPQPIYSTILLHLFFIRFQCKGPSQPVPTSQVWFQCDSARKVLCYLSDLPILGKLQSVEWGQVDLKMGYTALDLDLELSPAVNVQVPNPLTITCFERLSLHDPREPHHLRLNASPAEAPNACKHAQPRHQRDTSLGG